MILSLYLLLIGIALLSSSSFASNDELLHDMDKLVELVVLKAMRDVEREIAAQIEHAEIKNQNMISQFDDRVDERVDELEIKYESRLSQIERDLRDLADLKVALRIGLSIMGLVGISSIPQLLKILQSAFRLLYPSAIE